LGKAAAVKIWFAAALPQNSWGGVGRVMRELSARLQARGHECRLIYAGATRLHANYLFFAARLFFLLAWSLQKRPDWIIARSTDGVFCAMLARLLRLKTRVALHSHGWEEKVYEIEKRLPDSLVSPRTTWKARLMRFPLLRCMLALCDACICGTIEEARWIRKKYPRLAGKIVCVPNGVAALDAPFRAWQPLPAQKFLAVGNATWKKNIRHAVAVFRSVKAALPRAELCIVGCSMEEIVALTEATSAEGISAVRSEPPDTMPRWYEACPFFITLSRYEGGRSLAMLEAMSHGCVVFASAIPSSMECIMHGINGFILPSVDPREDASIIVQAAADPALCESVSRKAVLFAKRQSWERQALRCERVLCSSR
jgi:glycosyltransferase involved in cell wall biosynthesis